MTTQRQAITDKPVVVATCLGILFISLFLQHDIDLKQSMLFLTGIALGLSLMYALFGFSGAWRLFIRERKSAGVRAQLLLLAFSSILFFPVIAGFFPSLQVNAAMGQVGISVIIGAFIFGIGMQLGGGCGSGTLFTVGQGQIDMLITLAFFIIGSTLGSFHLGWWLSLPNLGAISTIETFGWVPALVTQLIVLFVLYRLVRLMEYKRQKSIEVINKKSSYPTFSDRLLYGPWPLSWGIVALVVLSFISLVIAGYPWSITFAFGLWGAKIWSALGGDIASYSYWSSGYPEMALNQSVLKDTTSVMNFGIILGATLSAAIAGKYAPAMTINRQRVITAIVGGLLLGYGARLAFGCNIGAMLGGIVSGSLHGWLWLVAAFIGSMLGVKIRLWAQIDKPLEAQ